MQPIAEGQEIPRSSPVVPPAGTGIRISYQEMPFHDSPNGPPSLQPTAKQSAWDGQDTPVKASSMGFARVGVGWIVQVVPFQCSASVTSPTPGAWHDTP